MRNGRIGELKTVEVGLPGDPSGPDEPVMPVPKNLNYDAWLGSTPAVPYTENRVHPQNGYGRPGWLRCEQFGAGMITGWGAHHVDTAHWGMDTEYTGPVEVWGSAEFPKSGLWDVHGDFKTEAVYANGVRMIVSGAFPNGIKFIGTEGWVFVSRGNETVTSSDPAAKQFVQPLAASNPKILDSVIAPGEIHLPESTDHHGNWLAGVKSRQQPIAPGRSRPSRVHGLPPSPHRHAGEAQAVLGPAEGAVQERRCRECAAVAAAAVAVCGGVRPRLECGRCSLRWRVESGRTSSRAAEASRQPGAQE